MGKRKLIRIPRLIPFHYRYPDGAGIWKRIWFIGYWLKYFIRANTRKEKYIPFIGAITERDKMLIHEEKQRIKNKK